MLALDWAEGSTECTKQFAFAFLLLLKEVSDNKPLAEIILEQHETLEDQGVSADEIRFILQRGARGPILLLIDGYDEYKKGTNAGIDRLLKNSLDNSLVILTSRPGPVVNPLAKCMNKTVRLTGFSRRSVAKYTLRKKS